MRRELPSLPRLAFGAGLLAMTVTLALGGCGARGPLDADDLATNVTANPDAADPQGSGVGSGGGPDAGPGGGPGGNPGRPGGPGAGGPGGPDGGGIGGIIACGTCVAKSCQAPILSCLQSTACRTAFQCVASKCLTSGTPNPACLLGCASGDPSGALGVISILTCLTTSCPDCTSVLTGGLGGGGGRGGRGGRGGGRPGGLEAMPDEGALTPEEALRAVTSPWPALMSRDDRAVRP
jgi:hypothetical protein